MKDARRIFILTLSFGSGHISAARAVATALKESAPAAEVRLLDALAHARWLFRALYVWPYWAMVRHAPSLWKKFFETRVARQAEGTAPAWAFRSGCPEVFREIARFKPDTIIAVEVAACEMAVIARRAGLTHARLINVITDHEAEPVWVKPEVDFYVVADERVRSQLCQWGAAPEKIAVRGIPTDARFSLAGQSEITRHRFGLDDDVPVVLLMGGGQGPTRMDQIAGRLCQSRVPMHVVAITGRDTRISKRLNRIRAEGRGARLHVLGWTEEVPELMKAASLLVTKPGGVTLAEAAQCGLPVVIFNGIPGPETVNAEYFASQGAGLVTRSSVETVAAVENLLRDKALHAAMSARSKRLARSSAARDVARLALNEKADVPVPKQQRMTA